MAITAKRIRASGFRASRFVANPIRAGIVQAIQNDAQGFNANFMQYGPGAKLPSYFSVTSSGGMAWDGRQFVSVAANDPEFWVGFGLASFAAGTNLALWSSDFSNAAWTYSGTKTAANSCIFGGVAQKCTSNAPSQPLTQVVGTFTGSAETLYFLHESGDDTSGLVEIYNGTTPATVARVSVTYATDAITLVAGSGTASGFKLADAGPNGGKLYLVAVTATGTAGNIRSIRQAVPTSGKYFYAHHGQLCTGSRILPPIVTGAATASRGASVYTITQPNMLCLAVNPTALTMGCNTRWLQNPDASQRAVCISDGTVNNLVILGGAATNQLGLSVIAGGVSQASDGRPAASGVTNKLAASITLNGMLDAYNGGAGTPDASVTMPAGISQVNLGHLLSAGHLNGFVQQAYLYPTTSTQADLNARTAP